jgi:predicted N-acetyltransferase YhbS
MITVQLEREEDYSAIHEINALAFGRENEVKI